MSAESLSTESISTESLSTESLSTGPAWPVEDDELVPPRPAVLEVA
jgi:hypothetical protein